MAVLFTRQLFTLIFLFLFFLLPQLSYSYHCPTNISCDPYIEISYPFYTSNDVDPDCIGIYLIQCNGGGRPTIQLRKINGSSFNYTVKSISYGNKMITVQPQENPTYYSNSTTCSFLYDFTDPIPHVDLPGPFIIDYFDTPNMSSCKWGKHDFPLLRDGYNYSACKNFNFYYSDKSKDDLPSPCRAPEAPLIEYTLSFAKVNDDGLSFLLAGFSNSLVLDPGCFEENVCNNDSKNKKVIAIAASVGGTLALIAICCIALLYKRRKRLKRSGVSNLLSHSTSSQLSSKKDGELGDSSYHTHIFSYEELQVATNGFDSSRELGDGGFGTVYKGTLRDGRTVAVKRLFENNYRRLEQFMNEVAILSRLRHQNLVTLYGCTSRHSRELILVYEFVPNGTIADHLHGTIASAGPLPWNVRMSIAIETAYALAYLHAVEPQIIHRDVKSNNILLDNNFHVKVADFGLSRLFPLDVTHVSTAPQGTPGYVDPEYHQCYQLTDKSDVYSFGVVLVELISSKPAVDISRSRHEINLANMAVTKIQNRQLDQLVDPLLGYQSDTAVTRMITQVAELAFTCLQSDGDLRPSIKEVLEELKAIYNVGYEVGKSEEAAEAQIREESELLKNAASPFSPDSVTDKWQSSNLTTPNNSG